MYEKLKSYFDKVYEVGLFGLISVLMGWIFWVLLAIPVYFLFGEDYTTNPFLLLWGGGCGGVWLGMTISENRKAKNIH